MTDIHRFNFGKKSYCGLRVWEQERRAQIFELQENDKETLAIDNILVVAQKIKETHFPNVKTSDINWNFVNGYWHSPIEFDEENGLCTRVKFNKGQIHDSFLSSQYSRATLEDYRQRYPLAEAEQTFTSDQSDTKNSAEIFPVYLPKMNGAVLYQKRNYLGAHIADDYEVVIADSQKVLELWKGQTFQRQAKPFNLILPWNSAADQDWDTGNDSDLLRSSLKDSRENIYRYPIGNAQDLPQAHYRPNSDNPLGFINGRHRLFNAMNCGAPFVPIEMYRCNDTEDFKMSFGWTGQYHRQKGHDLKVQRFEMF